MSTWMFAKLEAVHFEVWPHDILPMYACVHYCFCQLWILLFLVLSTWESVLLGFCLLGIFPLGSLAPWHSSQIGLFPLILSSWKSVQLGVFLLRFCSSLESGHMTFYPRRIMSTIGSVHSGFSPRAVLFNWDYVHLDVCLLRSYPLWSLATWRTYN